MGFRFRRSVKLLPGVRLNFSTSGISTTLGPRGASVSVGPRGTHLNVGLPGTGLSYRTRLDAPASDGTAQTGAPPGSAYSDDVIYTSPRAAARRRNQEERATARRLAEDMHSDREANLDALGNILRSRERDLIDWDQEYASLGPYRAGSFEPPRRDVDPVAIRTEVYAANPLRPWLLAAASGAAAAAIAPQLWIQLPAGLLAAYFATQVFRLGRLRAEATEKLVADRQAEYAEVEADARAAYEAEEADRARRHEQEEAFRARLRAAVANEDAEIVASALEVELSNEDLPLPVAFDIEFDGLRRVRLEVELPGLEEIPQTTSRVTKTGKFSERKMAQRDRSALYQDVCSGLALRLVHEIYRVLPFVEHVELLGAVEDTSPIIGRDRRYVALRLATTRSAFAQLDLDQVDHSQALSDLGGELSVARDGTLKSLEAPHE